MNPEHLKYTKDHEWIGEIDGVYAVGVTDHAQEQLGDITFVELPVVDTEVEPGVPVVTIESVKAASDVYAPAAGTVCAVNDDLEGQPELVNQSPYEDGWLFKLEGVDASELDKLMDAAAYKAYLKELDDA